MENEKIMRELLMSKKELRKLKAKNIANHVYKVTRPIIILSPLIVFAVGSFHISPKLTAAERKRNYTLEQVYDSEGNNSTNYLREKDFISTIGIYEPYHLNDEGRYERNYKVYELNDISEDKIKQMVDGEIATPEEICGEPVSIGTEIHDEVLEEDMNGYVEAKVYSESGRIYHEKLSDKEHVGQIFGICMLNLLVFMLATYFSLEVYDHIPEADTYLSKYYVEDKKEKVKELEKRLNNNSKK